MPDYGREIYRKFDNASTSEFTWTATEDCIIYGAMGGDTSASSAGQAYLYVNGKVVSMHMDFGYGRSPFTLILNKGDVLKYQSPNNGGMLSMFAFALK